MSTPNKVEYYEVSAEGFDPNGDQRDIEICDSVTGKVVHTVKHNHGCDSDDWEGVKFDAVFNFMEAWNACVDYYAE